MTNMIEYIRKTILNGKGMKTQLLKWFFNHATTEKLTESRRYKLNNRHVKDE